MTKNLMIIAGEVSGDLHGASLIKELKNTSGDLNIWGIGGDKMIEAGMTAEFHINDMAFLGFTEVVKHIPFISKVQKRLIDLVKEKKIRTAVLIDYPGFNLSMAKKFKKLGLNIIYYISPQIWAWGKGRIKKIKQLVNKMIVVFPFEKKLYSDAGVNVEYVGHPLIERINNYNFLTQEELVDKFRLEDKDILLIMPGSRNQEIEKIFPESIKAASKLSEEFNLQIVVACSPNIDEKIFFTLTKEKNFRVVRDHNYELMKYAKFGIIKSGTSTLEAGLFQLPCVVVYSTGRLTYLIGKMLIRLDNIAMVNIVAGENIVEELIQNDVNSKKIYIKCKSVLSDEKLLSSMKSKLSIIKDKLGGDGASRRAANIIYSTLNEA